METGAAAVPFATIDLWQLPRCLAGVAAQEMRPKERTTKEGIIHVSA